MRLDGVQELSRPRQVVSPTLLVVVVVVFSSKGVWFVAGLGGIHLRRRPRLRGGGEDALSLIIYWADQEGFRGLILIYLDLFLFILQKQVWEVAMNINMIGTEERQKAKGKR